MPEVSGPEWILTNREPRHFIPLQYGGSRPPPMVRDGSAGQSLLPTREPVTNPGSEPTTGIFSIIPEVIVPTFCTGIFGGILYFARSVVES